MPGRKPRNPWLYVLLAVVLLLGLDVALISFWRKGRNSGEGDGPHAAETFFPIDLSRNTNGVLHTSWLPNEDPGNNLASLPAGRHELGGVTFDVQGLIQLQGQCWVKRHYVLPKQVEGIPIHRVCRRVHILHANSGFGDPPGTIVAVLVLHYIDGEKTQLNIRHRENVLDFWAWKPETLPDTNAVVAWEGDSPATNRRGFGVRLCRTTFENPRPDKAIATVDYVSAMAGSAPFLVALTGE